MCLSDHGDIIRHMSLSRVCVIIRIKPKTNIVVITTIKM